MKKRVKRGLVSIVLVTALVLTLNTDLFQQLRTNDVGRISEAIGGNIMYILFITFVIMLIHNAFPVIPLVLVIAINNALLGFKVGFIWGVSTSVVCAAAVFLAIRFGFQAMITKRMNESIMDRIEKRGFFYVLVTRIFPFAPTSIINSLAAVSTMRLSVYVISTFIGNFVIFLVYTMLHAGLVSQLLPLNGTVISVLIAIVLFIPYYLKKVKKIKERKMLQM